MQAILVDGWRDGWRWWSARFLGLAVAWESAMLMLDQFPAEKAALVEVVAAYIEVSPNVVTSALMLLALLARFVRQPALHPQQPPPPSPSGPPSQPQQ